MIKISKSGFEERFNQLLKAQGITPERFEIEFSKFEKIMEKIEENKKRMDQE